MNKKNLYNKIMESISKEVKKTLNEGLPLEHHNDDYDEINYIFDLDELLDDEKTLKYYDKFPLRFLGGKVFGGPFMLNEDLEIELFEPQPTRTCSIEEVTKIGRALLGLDPGWVKTLIAANKIETCVLTLDKFDNINFIIEGMKAFGWTFSYDKTTIKDQRVFKSLHFDPMFQDVVNEEIKNCSLLKH